MTSACKNGGRNRVGYARLQLRMSKKQLPPLKAIDTSGEQKRERHVRNLTVKSSAMERATLEGEHLLDMSTEDMCVEEVPESPKQPVKSAFTPGS